ncbi:MAG TPA: FAD-dependent oxidoreductase, partial [Nevskiaceae bacterium]
MTTPRVTVIGAGPAGLTAALELSDGGAEVEVLERGTAPGRQACGWFAGGMLGPWYERADSDPRVLEWGLQALEWWPRHFSGTVLAGTLVLAQPRDRAELDRFATRTTGYRWLDADAITALEPDLADRFRRALFFPQEGHLDPRLALPALVDELTARGVAVRFGVNVDAGVAATAERLLLDCRGPCARDRLPRLRCVRGEMARVHTTDVHFRRPVRMLHPRHPVYVIPRADDTFMVGGTVIESANAEPVTVRSAMELLSSAYAIHPAFAEAHVVE